MARKLEPDATMYIYGLTDPRTGDYIYVGSTRNVELRYEKHKGVARGDSILAAARSELFQDIFAETGGYPEIEVLETTTYKDHRWFESLWINKLQLEGYELVNAGATWPSLDRKVQSVVDAPFPDFAKGERVKALEIALDHAQKKIEYLENLLTQYV